MAGYQFPPTGQFPHHNNPYSDDPAASHPTGAAQPSVWTSAATAHNVSSFHSTGSSLHSTDYVISTHSELTHALDDSQLRAHESRRAVKARAVQTIVDGIWVSKARRIQHEMISKGTDWRYEYGDDGSVPSIKMISSQNISELRNTLSEPPLEQYEKNFLDRILTTQMYISHVTNADLGQDEAGNISLHSRKKLIETNIAFPLTNSEDDDLLRLANDDHVFFSLEVGDEPQKNSSRFGTTMMRFKFDQPSVLKTAILHVIDPVGNAFPELEGRFEAINELPEEERDEVIQYLESRVHTAGSSMFHGKDMKVGLALSIIDVCRKIPKGASEKLLMLEDLNKLINGLFRPQVLVPRNFLGKTHDIKKIDQFCSTDINI